MAYDDAGKTLLHDCPFLIIPVVNEAFDEHYTGEEKIEFLREGEVLNLSENETLRNYKDGYFRIIGKECAKIYHIELQSVTDTTMVLRMFEYDMASAIKESVLENDKLTVQICDSAVVFLRHGDAIPDAMTIELITPGGNVSYDVKVVKIRHYSLD